MRYSWLLVVLLAGACSDPEPEGRQPCQCTTGARCDESGVCRLECQDDTACGLCDSCQDGLCRPTSPCRCLTPGDCSDGDPCNGEEECDNGVCADGVPYACDPSPDVCFDNVCHNDQGAPVCELEPSGACPCSTDPECDDGDACTGTETCQGGNCHPGTPHECPPTGAECRVNSCVDNAGTPICQLVLAPLGSTCDDQVACTDATCDSSGDCIGSPTVCNDGVDCTSDACNTGLDACEYTPVDAQCNDGKTCTVDTCETTGCAFAPDDLACDDGDVCTYNLCDPPQGDVTTGCRFPNNTAPCDDGNDCTGNDACLDGTCAGDNEPSFTTGCGTDGFCMDGLCLEETYGVDTPATSPCVQAWWPAGMHVVDAGDGVYRIDAVLNATFSSHASCTPATTYSYARRVEGGGLAAVPPRMAVDGNWVDRVAATTARVEVGLALSSFGTFGSLSGPGLGEFAFDRVTYKTQTDDLTETLVNDTPMGELTAAANRPARYYVGGRHESEARGLIYMCTWNGFWNCDASYDFLLGQAANAEPSAIHAAVDSNGDLQGLIVALRTDDGSFSILHDDHAGIRVQAGGDSGPFAGTRIYGVVARAWDDVFFYGTDGMLLQCTDPPNWTCTQLPAPQMGWTIRGGTITESGHMLLVGPFSFDVGTISIRGNRLLALPAGLAAGNVDNWVVLPMQSDGDTRVTRVAASATAIQALGETTNTGTSQVLIWSYEP